MSYFLSDELGDSQRSLAGQRLDDRPRRSRSRARRERRAERRRFFGLESLETRRLLAVDTVNPLVLERGDLDDNGTFDANDLDVLGDQIRRAEFLEAFDVNRDGVLDSADRVFWIESLHNTVIGDSNLDGHFGTSDLVFVFRAGHYEDSVPQNAGWGSGDWDGNREFDSQDLVLAFQEGDYEQGPRFLRTLELEVRQPPPLLQTGNFCTAMPHVEVRGQAHPFTMVTLWRDTPVGGEGLETTMGTDELGSFRFAVSGLEPGDNKFALVVVDVNGQQQTTPFIVTHLAPSPDPTAYGAWGNTVKTHLTSHLLPPSIATAFVPPGMTRMDMARELNRFNSGKPPSKQPASDKFLAALNITEGEPGDASGGNDTLTTAEFIDNFGTGAGQESSVTMQGALLPIPTPLVAVEDDGDMNRASETHLTPNSAAIFHERIGDGPHGSMGTGTGDSDFFAVRNVLQGQTITVDVTTPASSILDSFVYIYNSNGTRIDFSDDDGVSFDSFLEFVAPADGDYFISIAAFGSFGPADPFDSSSGIGASGEGEYEMIIGLDLIHDVDMYSFELQAGDILGARITGGGSHLTLTDAEGNRLIGSPQDASFIYPANSPLPREGRAALSWTVDTPGTYVLAIDQGVGNYELDLAAFRPYLQTQARNTRQILFLDFDGATITPQATFGLGPEVSDVDPLVNFLPRWGLTSDDEQAVIDAITATVRENFRDVGLQGMNGDRLHDGVDGHFQLDIITSSDFFNASGFPFDPFGSDHVTRVVVGGTIEQLGFRTLGLAQSIDPGNFSTSETAIVLLDLLSAAASEISSLNRFPLAAGASMIDLIGTAVGNIVTHEAGHVFGNWHSNAFNNVANLMDQGGNLAGMIGLGPDGIYGSADDVDVDFTFDSLAPTEGFTGVQNSLNSMAINLSTGMVDPGMIVVETVPGDDRLISVPATEFVVRFLDPYDNTRPIAPSSLTVNGTPANQVFLSGPNELTFRFNFTPIITQGLQQFQLAAGAVHRATDGSPVAAYDAEFGFDGALMNVADVSPPGGVVELPFGAIRVTFSEPYDPTSIGLDDLHLSLGQVADVTLIDAETVEYVLDNLITEGELLVTMPHGAVTDLFGNSSRGFTTSYTLEFGTFPLTTPLTPKLPMGSLIYDSVMNGTISSDLDVDVFTILVDPGQSISILVDTDSQLQAEIDLFRGEFLVNFDDALFPGQSVIVQNDPSTGKLISVRDVPTLFSIHVAGKGASTGTYRLKVLLNSAFEEETLGYPLNDIRVGAQNLEPAFRSLSQESPGAASVLGEFNGRTLFEDDFESGELNAASWTTSSSNVYGNVRATRTFGAADGAYSLIMDTRQTGTANLNEAIWLVDLDGHSTAMLSFAHVSFQDKPDAFSGEFVSHFSADGIAISNDGSRWYPIFNAPASTIGQWLTYDVDLSTAVSSAGLSLDDPLYIKFQQFEDLPTEFNGRGWDAIQIRHRDAADWYRIELSQGDSITLATTAQNSGHVQLELYDANGELVAEGLKLVQPLANGGFESGGLRGWNVHSTVGTADWSVAGAGHGGNLAAEPVAPQEGNFVAWSKFDGNGPLQTMLYQDIAIPADSAKAELSWMHRIQWLYLSATCADKSFDLEIRDPNTNEILSRPFSFRAPSNSSSPMGDTLWQSPSVDLSAYIGSTVRLAFVQTIPDSFSGPGQIQLDQIQLDLGQHRYTNVTDVIDGYVAEDTNDYFVRVTGDQRTEYSLLATRNVAFNLEANDDLASAQSLGPEHDARRWMMGHLDGASDASDFYVLRVLQPIDIETFKPAGAEGEFVNQLDPMIRVYDIHGNLLAEDDNSSDGINAALLFHPTSEDSDIYYVEVLAVVDEGVGGEGEYVLAVRGADAVPIDEQPEDDVDPQPEDETDELPADETDTTDTDQPPEDATAEWMPIGTLATVGEEFLATTTDHFSGATSPLQLASGPAPRHARAAAVDWLMAATLPTVSHISLHERDATFLDINLQSDELLDNAAGDDDATGHNPLA